MVDLLKREVPKPYIDRALDMLIKNKADSNDIDILEIGCMRMELNHSVDIDKTFFCCLDGHSTYLFARTGLNVMSIDVNQLHIAIAKKACKKFSNVEFVCQDAIQYAKKNLHNGLFIGLLYFDAWDVNLPECAEMHLNFYNIIKPLNDNCLVLIDDTDLWFDQEKRVYFSDPEGLNGKGKLLIPELLKDGYQILIKGRQTLLSKHGIQNA